MSLPVSRDATRLQASPSSEPGGQTGKPRRRGTIIGLVVLALVAVLIVATFAYTQNRSPPTENIQVESVTPIGAVVQFSGVNMTIRIVIENPNGVQGALERVDYTLFAAGSLVGDAQVPTSYSLPPQSNYTVSFPVNMGWGPASGTVDSYYVGGGSMNWELNGTVTYSFSGHSSSTPFEYSGVFGF